MRGVLHRVPAALVGPNLLSNQFPVKSRSDLHVITWHDAGRESQRPPNPAYPDGIDIDGSRGFSAACKVALPYPARRCGHYAVECMLCGIRMTLTTAGRPDDPRSLVLPCDLRGAA